MPWVDSTVQSLPFFNALTIERKCDDKGDLINAAGEPDPVTNRELIELFQLEYKLCIKGEHLVPTKIECLGLWTVNVEGIRFPIRVWVVPLPADFAASFDKE